MSGLDPRGSPTADRAGWVAGSFRAPSAHLPVLEFTISKLKPDASLTQTLPSPPHRKIFFQNGTYPFSRGGRPAISTSPENSSVPDTLPVPALLEAPSSTELPSPTRKRWNKLFSHPLLAPATHTDFQHPTTHICACQPSLSPDWALLVPHFAWFQLLPHPPLLPRAPPWGLPQPPSYPISGSLLTQSF